MFDLEKALAAWRQQHQKRRVFSADDMDELEQHVRDQIHALKTEGSTAKDAFEQTIAEMGGWDEAEEEYRKVFWSKARKDHRISEELSWRLTMLRSYMRVAFRSMKKQKVYTSINILGLTAGFTCFILMLLFVAHEFSYDQFHENGDNIYRVVVREPGEKHINTDIWAVTPAPLASAIQNEVAGINIASSIDDFNSDKALLSSGSANYWEQGFWGDAQFLNIFSFPLVQGNPQTALQDPNTILLTESLAQKIFSDGNVIGNTLTIDNEEVYTVTGILADVPANSSFKFSFVASLQSQEQYARSIRGDIWFNSSWQTFFSVEESADLAAIESGIANVFAKHTTPENIPAEITLQNLNDIHLRSDFNGEKAFTGDINRVYIFLAIGILVLLLACVNYINLAIAQSMRRIQEVGLRKVVGAGKYQLLTQFLGESTLTAGIALLFGTVLSLLLLPTFSEIVQRSIAFNLLNLQVWLPAMLGLTLLVGLVSGGYPAFYLASQQPNIIIKSKGGMLGGSMLQRVLIVSQYTATIVLLVCGWIIYQQLQYMRTANPGYATEQVISIPDYDGNLHAKLDVIRANWTSHPEVENVTFTRHLPTRINSSTFIADWDGSNSKDRLLIYETVVGPGFMDVFGLPLLAGRQLEMETPSTDQYLLNEAAANALGWTAEEAIGKAFMHNSVQRTVIGVMQDFHIHSMHTAIQPMMIRPAETQSGYIAVRVRTDGLKAILPQLRQTVAELTTYPFEYKFLDAQVDALYQEEEQLATLVGYFTIIALLLSSMGLFGLAAFTVEQRTKEIGIRKVLGATSTSIVYMIAREFAVLVIIATVLAIPVGFFTMRHWLEGFAYHINFGPQVFIVTALVTLTIALCAVSYQSIKATLTNPVNSLRFQ